MHDKPLAPGELKPKVEGETWDTIGNGLTADDILREVPGLAVDPFSIKGSHVLTYEQLFKPRPINNRRIAARVRRQRIEREKAGLFADEVAAEQKDPRQELAEMDARLSARGAIVDHRARQLWIDNFRLLATKSADVQSKLVAGWNASMGPKDHATFAGWLRKAEEQGLAEKITDRTEIEDPERRALVERMDKTWRTLKDIERAAKPDSPYNIAKQRLSEELAKYQSLGVEPPVYESDKPTWDELQAEKLVKQELARKEHESRMAMEAQQLLFPLAEIKQVFEKLATR